MKIAVGYKFSRMILVLVALGLAACGKVDRGFQARTSGGGGNLTGNGSAGSTCSSSKSSEGKIYDGTGTANFEAQVKAFVSATLDPSALGAVSGDINATTGIDFSGQLTFDSQGQLIPSSSNILIEIFDSYVGTVIEGETIEPYTISFGSASSGTVNRATGQFQAVFSDSYGSIVFNGRYDGTFAQGTVTFQNNTAVNGYAPASGTLGSFKIYSCALIK